MVAAPPMHVDYVKPIGADSPAQVLNVSAVPDGVYAQYNVEDRSSQQSSTKTTTSWTVGLQESLELKESVGDVDAGDGFSADEKLSSQQQWGGVSRTCMG